MKHVQSGQSLITGYGFRFSDNMAARDEEKGGIKDYS